MATPPQSTDSYPAPPAGPAPTPHPGTTTASLLGCQFCGGLPAIEATIRGHQGIAVISRSFKQKGKFCRVCGIAVHRSMTTDTLWRGWWGPVSFFFTPVVLFLNLVTRLRLAALKTPPDALRPPLNGGKPVLRRLGALGIFAPFLVVGAFALAISLDDGAHTAEVGDCVHNSGTWRDPDVTVVDCGSSEAQFKVAERHEDSSTHCDLKRFAEYSESEGTGGFVLCLTPLHEGPPPTPATGTGTRAAASVAPHRWQP